MTITGQTQKGTVINGTNSNRIFHIINNGGFNNNGVYFYINNLTLSNGKVTGNGGVIYNEGTVYVSNSTFTSNQATNGSVIYNKGTVYISDSTFTNNKATDSGGAIENYKGTVYVSSSTFTNNKATDSGGAIYNIYGSAYVNFNRIVGNTANTGRNIYSDFGSVDASLNWWGSNSNPVNTVNNVYNTMYSTLTLTSWLVLHMTSNPILIKKDGKSSIKLDFLHDSSGKINNPSSNHIPDGTPITFKTTLGSINSPISTINGVAMATLTSGPISGLADISATIDKQTIQSKVTINVPPTVTKIVPAKNAINIPRNQVIKITFSEPIKTGDMFIELKSSSGTLAIISTSISGNVLTINHKSKLNNGKYILTLHTGCITDLSGNPLEMWSSSFTVDSIPPKVALTYPKNGAMGISRTANIAIKFSENIKASTNWSKIVVKDKYGHAVHITSQISGTTIFIKTNKRAANSWYTVTIPKAAIKDYAGNNLIANYTFKFKTGT